MSTTASTVYVQHGDPFHVGDRIRKARESIGQDRQTFANTVGIHRETLAKYEETGHVKPVAIASITLATGVRREWLETGALPWKDEGPNLRPSD